MGRKARKAAVLNKAIIKNEVIVDDVQNQQIVTREVSEKVANAFESLSELSSNVGQSLYTNGSIFANYTREKAVDAFKSVVSFSSNVSEYINQSMINASEKAPLNIEDLFANNISTETTLVPFGFDFNSTEDLSHGDFEMCELPLPILAFTGFDHVEDNTTVLNTDSLICSASITTFDL